MLTLKIKAAKLAAYLDSFQQLTIIIFSPFHVDCPFWQTFYYAAKLLFDPWIECLIDPPDRGNTSFYNTLTPTVYCLGKNWNEISWILIYLIINRLSFILQATPILSLSQSHALPFSHSLPLPFFLFRSPVSNSTNLPPISVLLPRRCKDLFDQVPVFCFDDFSFQF